MIDKLEASEDAHQNPSQAALLRKLEEKMIDLQRELRTVREQNTTTTTTAAATTDIAGSNIETSPPYHRQQQIYRHQNQYQLQQQQYHMGSSSTFGGRGVSGRGFMRGGRYNINIGGRGYHGGRYTSGRGSSGRYNNNWKATSYSAASYGGGAGEEEDDEEDVHENYNYDSGGDSEYETHPEDNSIPTEEVYGDNY